MPTFYGITSFTLIIKSLLHAKVQYFIFFKSEEEEDWGNSANYTGNKICIDYRNNAKSLKTK